MKDNNQKPDPVISKEIKNIRKEVTEKGLNGSEDRFKLLFDYAPDGYYISDLEGTFIDGNKAAERITGYNRSELLGKNYFKVGLLSLKDVSKAISALKKNRRGLPTKLQEFTLKRKDGTLIDVEISTYPIRINKKMYALGIARDISKRKQLERALKNSEREKSVILNSSPMHVLYQDMNHNIIWANKTACDSIKKDLKEIQGKKCYEVWERSFTPCQGCPVDRVWKTGKMEKGERKSKDGKYWFINATPIKNDEGEITGIIETALDITEQKQDQKKLKKTMNAIIETISKIMDTRDPYTAGHQIRVSQLAIHIAQEMGLSPDKIESVRIASLIHDIGKIGIPSEILTKPTNLDAIEFSFIKKHPEIGYTILKDIDFPYPIAKIVLQHHERNDGSGYPQGLKGKDILLEAKIINVADVVEAMSSHRPYREALGVDVALDEITKNKGVLYDSEIVDVCVKLFKEKGFRFE
jgi:PAS domain S-box-containing protein/putative nucleotidyltransferase with HDIG domain